MSVQSHYQVNGMTCGGCARRVRKSLEELPGFLEANVDPQSGRVDLTSAAPVTESEVKERVETAGYVFAGSVT